MFHIATTLTFALACLSPSGPQETEAVKLADGVLVSSDSDALDAAEQIIETSVVPQRGRRSERDDKRGGRGREGKRSSSRERSKRGRSGSHDRGTSRSRGRSARGGHRGRGRSDRAGRGRSGRRGSGRHRSRNSQSADLREIREMLEVILKRLDAMEEEHDEEDHDEHEERERDDRGSRENDDDDEGDRRRGWSRGRSGSSSGRRGRSRDSRGDDDERDRDHNEARVNDRGSDDRQAGRQSRSGLSGASRMIRFFDRDSDGTISKEELERMPGSFRSRFGVTAAAISVAEFQEKVESSMTERQPDGQRTRSEPRPLSRLKVDDDYVARMSVQLADTFDRDDDGQLDKEELERLPESIRDRMGLKGTLSTSDFQKKVATSIRERVQKRIDREKKDQSGN